MKTVNIYSVFIIYSKLLKLKNYDLYGDQYWDIGNSVCIDKEDSNKDKGESSNYNILGLLIWLSVYNDTLFNISLNK
jgi:hypothetical protein